MKHYKRLLLPVLFLVLSLTLGGCLRYTSNILEVTRPVQEQPATAPQPENVTQTPVVEQPTAPAVSQTAPVAENTTAAPVPVVTQPQPTQPAQPVTAPPVENTTQGPKDPSQWSRDEILANLTTAINTSKAYTGQMTVEHTEDFSFDITKCPGGSIGVNLANRIASGVLKPKTETLNYSGGTTVDSDGKTVPLLLPKRNNFSLPASGVKSARAFKSGANTVIEVTLVSEHGSIDAAPKYNAGAIGYLDSHDLDLSLLTIKTFDVVYAGSSLVVNIDAQGRVVSASYNVPIEIDASGSALAFSGEFACTGSEKEIWKLNW